MENKNLMTNNEMEHRVSDNVLHWVYFALAGLALVGLVIIQVLHSVISVFGFTFDTEGTKVFIEQIPTILDGGAENGLKMILAAVLVVLVGVGVIIFIVRFIIQLVNFLSLIKGGQKRSVLHGKFRKSLKSLVGLAGYYLLVDLYFVVFGAGLPSIFAFDVAVVAAVFLATSLNYILYETFNREGKFDWKVLVYEVCSTAVYAFVAVLALVSVMHRSLFDSLMNSFNVIMAGDFAGAVNGLSAFIFAIVAVSFAKNIFVGTGMFYPHNDAGGKGKEKRGMLQTRNIVQSALFLVFSSIMGTFLYLAGVFTTLTEAFIATELVPTVLLLVSIALKVAYNFDHPAPEDEDE